MWKEYFNLNKHKPFKPLLIIGGSIFFIITILSQVLAKGEDKLSLAQGLFLGLIISIYIIVITLTVSFSVGLYNFWRKRKRFNKINLKTFFSTHNFKTEYAYQETRLRFTEEVKSGFINKIPVVADILPSEVNFVQFRFFVDSEPIPKKRFKALTKKFKDYNAYLGIGYICKKISKKSSPNSIETELGKFSNFLLSERFKPMEDVERLRTTTGLAAGWLDGITMSNRNSI